MNKIITGKYYRTLNRNVQLLIDESFAEREIPANDRVRLLDEVVEEMDLTPLMRAYEVRGRNPATAPLIKRTGSTAFSLPAEGRFPNH